ncbi:MATE family efflux transporter [Clostridium sp.]|uniref:MATE family efflux transporter n=1 Tax=Clostridium sp. TaxID=1506 RepID=UPI003216DABC
MINEKFNNRNNIDSKKLNKMALPLILNSVTTMIIGLCDQAMVGRISIEAFGVVGLIASTINSITGVLGMTSIAFNILGSKYKGKKDSIALYESFAINLIISLVTGLAFFILTLLFGKTILQNLYNLKGTILNEGVNYLYIFSLSVGLNMILFTFSSYLKIVNNTKYILYANVISSVLNVVFDYIFIFGHLGFPKMGMKGNAFGSVLALAVGIVIYLITTKPLKLFKDLHINFKEVLNDTLKVSIPLMGQEILESTLVIIIINSILSHIGILEVSVYNLLSLIINIALMPMYSYSQTSLTFVSESLGACDKTSINKTPKTCMIFTLILYFIIAIIVFSLNHWIFRIITNDLILIKSSSNYIGLALIINVFNIPNTIYRYSLQGIGYEKWVFVSSILINFIGVILMFIFSILLRLNLYGIYIGLLINFIILSITFYNKYNKAYTTI